MVEYPPLTGSLCWLDPLYTIITHPWELFRGHGESGRALADSIALK
jgi:hypothetical protein